MRRDDLTTPADALPRSLRGALESAGQTFGDFQDDPDSYYYVANGLTPEQTWQRVSEEAARVNALTIEQAAAGEELQVADFEAVHRAIFEPIFGDSTLGLRSYGEQVEFGIVRGDQAAPVYQRQRGGQPQDASPPAEKERD